MRTRLENTPTAVKAWLALQMFKSSLSYHKSEGLGEFIYDIQLFSVEYENYTKANQVLVYRPRGQSESILPHGLISCRGMFRPGTIPENFTLGDKFDTSNVIDMTNMFYDCVLPEGFTLGDKFDTSKVVDMSNMFRGCTLPEGFTLGDKFDTSKVVDMINVFNGCTLPTCFTLGDKFATGKVTDMEDMFKGCTLPSDPILREEPDSGRVSMFFRRALGKEQPREEEDPRETVNRLRG